jgi:hypothetical protein
MEFISAESRQLPIAVFDFDGTLVYHLGRGPPSEKLAITLLKIYSLNWRILIYSNQKNVQTIQNWHSGLNFNCDVIAAVNYELRKPRTIGWKKYLADLAGRGIMPNKNQLAMSFMCGDAAGRPGDFSASDRWFAQNCNLMFFTPEQIFGIKSIWEIPQLSFEYLIYQSIPDVIGKDWDKIADSLISEPVIIMVGAPGSGKSTFAALMETRGFTIISRDQPGQTKFKMYNIGRALIARGKPVIVDNTHNTVASRKECCEKLNITDAIFVWAAAARWISTHYNFCRFQPVPPIGVATFWKYFEPPTKNVVRLYYQFENPKKELNDLRLNDLIGIPKLSF